MLDFVVSDIHGCYLTWMKLLHRYFDPTKMRLILLGDYLDKGSHSYEMYCWLKKQIHNPNCVLLRGNHEQEMIEYVHKQEITCWYEQDGRYTLNDLAKHHISDQDVVTLFNSLPLFYDTPHVFYSHAGVSIFKHDPSDPNDPCGLLWNRMTVANIGKLQVFGHTPHLNGPFFQTFSQSYQIDTGVFLKGSLSALVIDENGQVLSIYKEKTDPRDLARRKFLL